MHAVRLLHDLLASHSPDETFFVSSRQTGGDSPINGGQESIELTQQEKEMICIP